MRANVVWYWNIFKYDYIDQWRAVCHVINYIDADCWISRAPSVIMIYRRCVAVAAAGWHSDVTVLNDIASG